MDSLDKKTIKKQNFVFELIVNFATALLIFLLFYYFIAQTHEVHGASMLPNFTTGDRVITEKVTRYFNDIKRGEVVIVHSPVHTEPLIKRVIGLPGETIEIKNGEVYVNGIMLSEDYLKDGIKTSGQRFLKDGVPYTLSNDEYLVMGDNRPVSSDSRSWGTVKREDIIGHAFFRYWPLSKFGFVRD